MCGRYSSTKREIRALERELELNDTHITPRFNIGPMQFAPVVTMDEQGRCAVQDFRWGLVPIWSKTDKTAAKCINARSETVAKLNTFRSAYKSRRCLVIADGFYEWIQTTKPKQPVRFMLDDPDAPMIFAGLWESWRPAATPDEPLLTFTILTTTPNETVAKVHDRMPVILPPTAWRQWLNPGTPVDHLPDLLKPYEGKMRSHWVSPAMNNVRFEHPSAIDPIPTIETEVQLPLNSL